eukprot:Skav226611  [mRNA]  locus=scaffold2041:175749:177692:- [translate_table: standard]
MAALNCHFAEALCLGIGDYDREERLPKAAEDAERMKKAFEGLGCCNVTFETNAELLTRQKTMELVSGFVLRTKLRMREEEAAQEPLLVALFVASHGIHAHGKELPLIVPADLMCSSQIEELIDLDLLLLNELAQVALPKSNRRTCCVWIIMDTCRSGPITAWQRRHSDFNQVEHAVGYRGPYSVRTSLTPDFLLLYACDPGGWASDSDSLSSALVRSLQQDGISIRDACEQAVGVVQQASRGRQRPWMNQRAGPIFSQIRRMSSGQLDEELIEVECVPRWVQLMVARGLGVVMAFGFCVCFFGLFFHFQIDGAEHVARGEVCPSNSCFCTDCHHRDIYSNRYSDPAQFDCEFWQGGLGWNRCNVATLLHVIKCALALIMSRSSWSRLYRWFWSRDRATPLDLCVSLVSAVNVLTSLRLPLQDSFHVSLMAYSYGILNFAFISASLSILMLIHTEFPRMSQWSGGHIVSNFTAYFLVTSLIGQGLIYVWSNRMGLIGAERAGKQEMLFYAFHVFTGAVLAMAGFAMSKGKQVPVAKKSCHVLLVSLSWMFVVLAWLLTSHYNKELMAKYHLLRVVAERACNFWKMHLMVWFSEHSIRCALLRGRSVGPAAFVPCRLRSAMIVQADASQPEQISCRWNAAPLVQEFHML